MEKPGVNDAMRTVTYHLIFIGLLFSALPVLAHIDGEPLDSQQSYWADRQRNLDDKGCCGLGDAQVLEDDEWRIGPEGRYQVLILAKWRDVQPYMGTKDYQTDPNPTGHAVVWWNRDTYQMWFNNGYSDDEFNPAIFCFVSGELM